MKKLILIALCFGLFALGSASKAEAYSQTGLTNWKAGDTVHLSFNMPANLDAVISAWLNISAINTSGGNDHVMVNGSDVGVISMGSDSALQTTRFNLTDFFANYTLTGQPLNVAIYSDGPLCLGPSMLALEYAYYGSAADPPSGNAPVPEPATLLLLGTGLSGLAFWGKRRRIE